MKKVDVDSGTLLIIDPCYLKEMLNLTDEQEASWKQKWHLAADQAGAQWKQKWLSSSAADRGDLPCGIAEMHVNGYATAIILTCFGGDGGYSPRQIAGFLNPERDNESALEQDKEDES